MVRGLPGLVLPLGLTQGGWKCIEDSLTLAQPTCRKCGRHFLFTPNLHEVTLQPRESYPQTYATTMPPGPKPPICAFYP